MKTVEEMWRERHQIEADNKVLREENAKLVKLIAELEAQASRLNDQRKQNATQINNNTKRYNTLGEKISTATGQKIVES